MHYFHNTLYIFIMNKYKKYWAVSIINSITVRTDGLMWGIKRPKVPLIKIHLTDDL